MSDMNHMTHQERAMHKLASGAASAPRWSRWPLMTGGLTPHRSPESQLFHTLTTSACLGSLMMFGCAASREPPLVPPPAMLGSEVDQLMTHQERNAEASKFVIPMHEFELNQTMPGERERGWRLNESGEDHVKQIAVRLRQGQDFLVVIERSQTTALDDTEFEYPVHFNEELDGKRRAVVVAALVRLGISDADQRVVAAPSLAEGITANEAVRAYSRVIGTNSQTGSVSTRGGGAGSGNDATGVGSPSPGSGGGAATGPGTGSF